MLSSVVIIYLGCMKGEKRGGENVNAGGRGREREIRVKKCVSASFYPSASVTNGPASVAKPQKCVSASFYRSAGVKIWPREMQSLSNATGEIFDCPRGLQNSASGTNWPARGAETEMGGPARFYTTARVK